MFDRQQSIRRARAWDISSTDDSFTEPTRSIYVTGAGNMIVELADNPGVSVTYAVLANTRHPLRAKKIVKTSTTATGILEW